MRIIIPGGSGQVGTILARHFHARGHAVTVLSRAPRPAPWQVITWDGVTPGPWTAELEQSDVCINLTGRSVNCRYTEKNRRAIFDSRIRGTLLLNEVISSLPRPPRLWLNASTATIYRHSLDRAMDEATGELGGNEPGAPDTWNFSIDVAKSWEQAFFSIPTPRTRKIAMRSAITLSPDHGGVFDVLLNLVRRGLGGRDRVINSYPGFTKPISFAPSISSSTANISTASSTWRRPILFQTGTFCGNCAAPPVHASLWPLLPGYSKSVRSSCGPNRNSF